MRLSMDTIVSGETLHEVFPAVLAAVLEGGEPVAPRGLATRELCGLMLKIRKPHNRFVRCAGVDYPRIALRQLLSLSGFADRAALSYYETVAEGEAHSAAYKYDDLSTGETTRHLVIALEVLTRDPESRQAIFPVLSSYTGGPRMPITVSVQFFLR